MLLPQKCEDKNLNDNHHVGGATLVDSDVCNVIAGHCKLNIAYDNFEVYWKRVESSVVAIPGGAPSCIICLRFWNLDMESCVSTRVIEKRIPSTKC